MMTEKEYKRILIIEVNWLGDVLFSTPLIKAVRKRFKNAHIACMTVPRCKEILENNPNINEIIIYDEKGKHVSLLGKWRLICELRKKHFDLAIILHRSFTRALMAFLAGITERVGYDAKKRGFLLTKRVEFPDRELHKTEHFLKIAESLGCDTKEKACEFFVSDEDKKFIKGELSKAGIDDNDLIIVINPGGNWGPKRWDPVKFAKVSDRLIDKYRAKIILSGAKKDIPLAEKIKNNMKNKPIIFTGRMDLKKLGALLERANFVISGDSGPMHMAVALKTNVIALFGPTSPRLTGPFGDGNYEVIKKDVGCDVPCYDVTCGDYRCMNAVTVDDVIHVFEEMYGK
ncbi:MAG: lipopolysaccharide heptosyltransferase II [Candidatus Omnitrophota bacterium]